MDDGYFVPLLVEVETGRSVAVWLQDTAGNRITVILLKFKSPVLNGPRAHFSICPSQGLVISDHKTLTSMMTGISTSFDSCCAPSMHNDFRHTVDTWQIWFILYHFQLKWPNTQFPLAVFPTFSVRAFSISSGPGISVSVPRLHLAWLGGSVHIDTARRRPPSSTPSPCEASLHCQKWVPHKWHWTKRPCKGHMLPCTSPPLFLGFGGALSSSDGGRLGMSLHVINI